MQLSARHDFAADPATVYAMITDPAFLEQACRDVGAVQQQVSVAPGDGGDRTEVDVTVPAPGPMASFTGPHVRVTQAMAWGAAESDGSRTARLTISVAGLPVSVAAACRMAPSASGTEIVYDGDLTVNVPLFGRSIEQQAAPFVLETLDIQQRSGEAWLAQRR